MEGENQQRVDSVTKTQTASPKDREVVGLFADRETFEAAVDALLDAGFQRPDLSVLASHESIDAAGKPGKKWKDALTAMVGELKYEGPLVASGAILLVGGQFAAAVAGVIGAAVGGVAVKELLDEVTSTPHTEHFARSLEAGSVILWVQVPGDDQEADAIRILETAGGANVHIHAP